MLLCARVCTLLSAWGWFTANWFVNVALVSLKTERATRISVPLACMIHLYGARMQFASTRVGKNTGNFYQPHLIIAAGMFPSSSMYLSLLFLSHLWCVQ